MFVAHILTHQVDRRHGEHAQDLATVALCKAGERRAIGEAREEFGNRLAAVEIRRNAVEHLLEVGADAAQSTVELEVPLRELIAAATCGELLRRLLWIAPEGERPAVGVRRKGADLGLDELHAPLQPKVAGDARTEATDGVGEHRRAHAVDLGGERHATKLGARLNEQGAHAGARKVRRGDEPVVAAANNDRVVHVHGCAVLLGH